MYCCQIPLLEKQGLYAKAGSATAYSYGRPLAEHNTLQLWDLYQWQVRQPYDPKSSLQWLLNFTQGIVEHLVLDLRVQDNQLETETGTSFPEECTQATLSTAVGTLKLRGIRHLQKDADILRRYGKLLCKMSPATVSKHIQLDMEQAWSFHSLQRDLEAYSAIQQDLLNLSPKTVRFISHNHKRNRQLQLDEMIKRTFPTLFEWNIAKTVFRAGA